MSKKLIENVTSLYIVQGLTLALGIIIQPFLARQLGPEFYGKVIFAQAFMQYFILLTDYGFNWSATQQIALNRNDQVALSEIFWATQIVKLGLMAVSFVGLAIILLIVPTLRSDVYLYLITFLIVVGNVAVPLWYFQGMENLKYVAAINLIARVATLYVTLAYVTEPADYLVAAGAQAAVGVLMGLAAFAVIYYKMPVQFVWPTIRHLRAALSDGWEVFLSTVSHSVYTATNITLLGFLTPAETFGVFSAAYKIIQAISGILSPFVQSLYPHISSIGKEDKAQAREIILKYLRYGACVFGCISLGLLLLAEPIITTLFGPKFASGSILLKLMAPIPFFLSMAHCFATLYLLGLGYKKQWSRIILSTQLVNFGSLGVTFLLMPFDHAVALTLTLNELWVLGASYWYWRRPI